jgi:hypothetical protein
MAHQSETSRAIARSRRVGVELENASMTALKIAGEEPSVLVIRPTSDSPPQYDSAFAERHQHDRHGRFLQEENIRLIIPKVVVIVE